MNAFLSIDQNKLYYQDKGSGTPLVFIHGSAVDHRMWRPQVAYFSDRYRVITYDIRGHGQSAYESNEQPDMNDLRCLLDHLNIEQASVVGLSLGAIFAIDFVLEYPERVDRLILMSPGLIGVQEKEHSYLEPIRRLIATVESGDMEGAADVIQQMTFLEKSETESLEIDAMKAMVKETTTQYFKSGNYTRPPQLREAEPVSRLHEITCPTLLIHGAEDADYMVKNVAVLEQKIPNSQQITISGVGHLVNVEGKQAVNKAIEHFIK